MHEDDARPEPSFVPANDNEPVLHRAQVDAALLRIADAIGRHIAREHIRLAEARRAASFPPRSLRASDPTCRGRSRRR